MSRRLHSEILLEISTDLAGEHILGKFDEEQDDDNLTQIVGPYDVKLAAGAGPTELAAPIGGVKLRFLAIMKLDNSNGVQVHFDGSANDPVLVKPPIGTGMEGQMTLTTSADSVHVTNPDSAAEVNFSVMAGYAPT